MKIATTNKENSVDEVVDRVIGHGADRNEFRARLMKLNPHLEKVGALPAGTPIVLPGASDGESADTRLESAFDHARQTLADTAAEIDAALQLDAKRAALQRQLLDSPDVIAAAKTNHSLATKREETIETLKKAEQERGAFSAEYRKSVKELATVLKGTAEPRVDPILTRPPVDTKPPDDTRPPVDTKPPDDTRPPVDTKPPDDTRPPVDTKPPDDTRPPVDTKPPDTTRPPVDTKPPDTTRPPVDTKPPDTTRPPVDTKPPDITRPPVDTKPPDTPRPPVDTKPPDVTHPPVDTKPPDTPRPSVDTKPPDTTPRPPVEVKPPDTITRPPVEVRLPDARTTRPTEQDPPDITRPTAPADDRLNPVSSRSPVISRTRASQSLRADSPPVSEKPEPPADKPARRKKRGKR